MKLNSPFESLGIAMAAALLSACPQAMADVSLPAYFSDHAVLQRSAATPVWGKAAPGEKVKATLGAASAETLAGKDGKWKLALDLSKSGPGPFELTVQGENKIVVKDALVGDVWLCCGQSNMFFNLRYALGAKEEIARSANASLRQFKVKTATAAEPQDELSGVWTVASPESSGEFSAVAYYFGSKLQRELGIPIGLVNASYNGSSVEAWTSQASLGENDLKERAKYLGLPKRFEEHRARYREWEARFKRQDVPAAAPESFLAAKPGDPSWLPVKLPGQLSGQGFSSNGGAVWLRHALSVSPEEAGKPLRLSFDELRFGTVYLNGEKIDEMTPESFRLAVSWEAPWTCRAPGNLVRAGENQLAIRLFSPAGGASLKFNAEKEPLLAGAWQAKEEYSLPPLDAANAKACPGVPPVKDFYDFFSPSSLFDAMANPLVQAKLKGVIWYQGEANAHRPALYAANFQRLMNDWRAKWNAELPFYFCQLPNQGRKKEAPAESQWAELREAQAKALALPSTGMAVLIDTADADLHPLNKKDPGERLALQALAKTYGKDALCEGPRFVSASFANGKAVARFENCSGGLLAKKLPETHILKYQAGEIPVTAPLVLPSPGSEVQGFAVCGADRVWKWAQAEIVDGGKNGEVRVWSPEVAEPVAVRYAWADNPTCNLFNGSGLPAAPFRSDATAAK